MKLLPAVLPHIKDAARSVKRICLAEFRKVEDPILTELPGIPILEKTGVDYPLHLKDACYARDIGY